MSLNDPSSNRRALENLVTGNRDLATLEAMVSRFNFFEALGIVNSELRHSRFLAFLLNPRESHRMGDLLLKRLLQEVLAGNQDVSSLTPIDIDIRDFGDCEVQTEANNIDILLCSAKHRLAVIIENKVNTDQHSDQLARYYEKLLSARPGWEVFGIYLTRFSDPSNHPKYASLSHATIGKVLCEVITLPQISLDTDIRFALSHYTEMLGRHFMANEDIKDLCTKIYQHHKQAIDLIIENLPNQRDMIAKELKRLISEANFILDDEKVQTIRFIPNDLNLISFFHGGYGWSKSGRMLLFEFPSSQPPLQVKLMLGPGEDSKRSKTLAITDLTD